MKEIKVLLRAVVEEGTALSAKQLKRPVYGKTGTTNDYTDAWFIGFDDRLAVGVWVGRDDHKPIGVKKQVQRLPFRYGLNLWGRFIPDFSTGFICKIFLASRLKSGRV